MAYTLPLKFIGASKHAKCKLSNEYFQKLKREKDTFDENLESLEAHPYKDVPLPKLQLIFAVQRFR